MRQEFRLSLICELEDLYKESLFYSKTKEQEQKARRKLADIEKIKTKTYVN